MIADLAEVLSQELRIARAAPPCTLALSRDDVANLAAVRDAWNADRKRRGMRALSSEDVLRKGLEVAAAWLAEKETIE